MRAHIFVLSPVALDAVCSKAMILLLLICCSSHNPPKLLFLQPSPIPFTLIHRRVMPLLCPRRRFCCCFFGFAASIVCRGLVLKVLIFRCSSVFFPVWQSSHWGRELIALLIASCLYVCFLVCRSSSWHHRLVWHLWLFQFIAISTRFLLAYPGSGVQLDCIDSWSLPPFLLRNDYPRWYVYLYNWSGNFCYIHFWIKCLFFPWLLHKHHGYLLSDLLTCGAWKSTFIHTPQTKRPWRGVKSIFLFIVRYAFSFWS